MRYGHPGSFPTMPAFVDSSMSTADLVDILAYVQTLPTTGGTPGGDPNTPPSSEREIVAMGGLLFDSWFETKGVAAPDGDMPLWANQTTNTRTGPDTWRCKECHGWDYKGKDGQYGPGSSHYTGFAGLFNIASDPLEDEAAIISILNGVRIGGARTHDFSPYLTVNEIAALAKFIKLGMVDTDTYISATTGVAKGDATRGEILYTYDGVSQRGNCSACHGVDGQTFNFGTETAPEYLHELSIENPWEVLHKARFGQPATAMPSMYKEGMSIDSSVDILRYLQDGLPAVVVPRPRPIRPPDND